MIDFILEVIEAMSVFNRGKIIAGIEGFLHSACAIMNSVIVILHMILYYLLFFCDAKLRYAFQATNPIESAIVSSVNKMLLSIMRSA